MSVWIVTQGSYSDYHIVAIFASEEEARLFVNGCDEAKTRYGCESDIAIEEWPLGNPDGNFFQKTWQAWISETTGNQTHPTSFSFHLHPRDWSAGHAQFSAREGDRDIVAESVVSEEHALKIAAEVRQSLLRESLLEAVK